MIKIEKVDVHGFEAAVRGMRNSIHSCDESDSGFGCNGRMCNGDCNFKPAYCGMTLNYQIGNVDKRLMKKLISAGDNRADFMRMIVVYCDITAPLLWWEQMDIYKVGIVRCSCSPENLNQKSTVLLNYQILRHIYHTQKRQQLTEWKEFCEWVKELPYAKELITTVWT